MHSIRVRKGFVPALVLTAPVLFFFATVLLITPATAQKIKQLPPPPPGPRYKPKPTPEPQYEVLRISSNLVVVPVSVIDGKGQPVLGLKKSEFHIEEDGRVQEITQMGDPEQVPLDIAILIDVSSSVSQRFAFEEQAATRFITQVLRPMDRATVYAIDSTPRLEQARSTAELASAKLMSIKAATGPSPTAFYDTVIEAARYLTKNTPEQHRRVIVVISDGEDNYSNRVRDSALAAYRATQADENDSSPAARKRMLAASEAALQQGHRKAQAEVQQEVQTANAVFYSINPSGQALRLNVISTRAQDAMQQLATATGGTAFVPDKPEDLEPLFARIANELRAQYLLQYYSNNKSAGPFRRIVVSTPAQPQVRVRAREGYYPKAK
ncbi:MAG TPA: VWA domain-containing protein [Pyrinomonadaceae bacterium]|nr:VWA domain-containing protein [Pyrinomonadaceae bacterium]